MIEIDFITLLMALITPLIGGCLALAILSIPAFIKALCGKVQPWS